MDVRVDAGEVLHGLPADRLDHSVVAEETAFAARAYSILELQGSVQLVLRHLRHSTSKHVRAAGRGTKTGRRNLS